MHRLKATSLLDASEEDIIEDLTWSVGSEEPAKRSVGLTRDVQVVLTHALSLSSVITPLSSEDEKGFGDSKETH